MIPEKIKSNEFWLLKDGKNKQELTDYLFDELYHNEKKLVDW